MKTTETDAPGPEATAPPRRFRRLRRVLRPVQWAVNLAVAAGAMLAWTPAGDWLEKRLIAVDPPTKADYIVVLGGGHSRAVEAADLYRDGWAGKVIFTSRFDDADLLAEIARSHGVPKKDVITDRDAMRTADHPRTLAALPGVDKHAHRFLIVTSALHTSRARACFRRAGFRSVCMRAPNWEKGGRLAPRKKSLGVGPGNVPALVRELLAWGYYKLRGWL